MNIQVLIDAVVRQTTVLIAQLATSGGVRAPLAHVANSVFLDLARELEAQGVSRKVSADMFGMALRAYVRKVQRLNESSTDRGRSLWEAVYDYVRSREVVSRAEVIQRFHRDEEVLVRGVLHDLNESGLVFSTGTGPGAAYRAASETELKRVGQFAQGRADEILWVLIYREGPLSRETLERIAPGSRNILDEVLERLVSSGRVERIESAGEARYRARAFAVPLGAEHGWEAALLDHYHALVRTMCQKLRGPAEAHEADTVGGSTYTFAVWEGHPLRDEVLRSLARFRSQHSELRERVDTYNRAHPLPARYEQVVVYGGQSVTPEDDSSP